MSEHQTEPRQDAPAKGCCGCGGGSASTAAPGTLATDPVCGMKVDPATSRHRLDHAGRTFYFCSVGCRAKFVADPDGYLKPKAAATPAKPGAIYTCPMHPQIRQAAPGSCPICGMALEPVEVSAEAQPNRELADMSRRFWIGLVLTLPVFVLEMGSHIPGLGLHELVPPAASTWVQFEPSGFASVTGKGVTGTVGGRVVALGNAKLMADQGISLGDLAAKADELRGSGATALFVGVDGRPGGVIAFADPIKPTTRAALDGLRADGIHVVMLTGDNRVTAEAVARQLGIGDVEADVLPEDKNRIVRALRAKGKVVAMAGDGVNDAPALAEADVGTAMGTGTEVAIQSAGVTLVRGDLAGIARARALSRMTMHNIRQNLVFAFAYNAVGIPVAAGVLYPTFGVLLSPVVAALAMSLSSVSVIANALRLRAARL